MYILDKEQIRRMHNLMRKNGVHKINISMFSEQQQKIIYNSYAEQFFSYGGLGFMVNCVVPYALANNLEMVDKKLKQEIEYALKQSDYEYAFLCARLLNDNAMVEFLKQYNVTNKYDKIFDDLNKFIKR